MKRSIVDVFKKIGPFFYPYLLVLMACFIIKALYTKDVIYYTVNGWHFTLGDTLFQLFTDMGDGLFIIALSIVVLAFNYRKGFLLVTSYLLTSWVAQAIKHIVKTPRPIAYFKDTSHMYLVKGVEMFSSMSFPSGHTTSAFSAAVVLTYVTPKKLWGLLYLLIAMAIGYSRMYLSEHFFEDVVGGSAIGTFVTIIWVSFIDNKAFIHTPGWDRGFLSVFRSKTN